MRGLGAMRGAMMQGMGGGGMRGGMGGGMRGGMGGMGGMGGGMAAGGKTNPAIFMALLICGCMIGCSCMASVCRMGFFNKQARRR